MVNENFEFFCILGLILLIIFGTFALVGVGVYYLDKKSCLEIAETMELEHKYSIWTGCLLKTSKGQYIDSNAYHSYING